jgi:ACS family hexuronate transporter-like MFS transporter
MVWTAAWFALCPPDPRSPAGGEPLLAAPIPWRILLGRREAWGIISARFFGDPIWWLYLNWLPLYLSRVRGFTLKEIGGSAWVPFLAAGVGCLLGGALSGRWIGQGWTVNRARKTAIAIGAACMPAGILAAYAPSSIGALAWISLTLFGFQFWVGNVQTLASDFFPVGAVGSIAGFSGTAAGIGAVIFTLSTGWVVDHFSYTPILIVAGVLAPLATGILFLLVGRIRPLEISPGPLPT